MKGYSDTAKPSTGKRKDSDRQKNEPLLSSGAVSYCIPIERVSEFIWATKRRLAGEKIDAGRGGMMRKLRALWMRLCGVLRKPQGDSDFEAELASHVAMHIDDGIRAGLSRGGSPPPGAHSPRRRGANPAGLSRAARTTVAGNARTRPCLQSPPARETSRNHRHRRAFDRPGHGRQRHHLLHGQPVCSASRAGRRSIDPVGHPEARRECALVATLPRSSRPGEIFLRNCRVLSAAACLHRRSRRTGTRVGSGGHRKLLRCRRHPHDARARFREQRRTTSL